ncbi:hypothetical protein RRG08_014506, partial [Elysia crispata]
GHLGEWGERLSRLPLRGYCCTHSESTWGVGRAAVAPSVKGLLLHTFRSQLGEWGERLSRLPLRGYCCTHSESTWGVGRAAVAPAVKGLLLHTFRVNLGSGASGCRACR